MKTIFYCSIAFIGYTYILFPLLLFLIASIVQLKRDIDYVFSRKDRRCARNTGKLPRVTMVVAAYNEEKVIEDKIRNCLELDYPEDLLEVIVASDGSSDRTNELVETCGDRRIKLKGYTERSGKASVLNRTIPTAEGEIIILSDANTFYSRDAVKKLIRHFENPEIGGACGEMRLQKPEDGTNEMENSYWHLENVLKFLENRIGATLGANGGIYAIRKGAFTPIPDDTIIDDFIIFMKIRERGLKTVFDPEALAYEDVAPDVADEFRRRVRIGAGNIQSLGQLFRLLNPARGAIPFAFWSHKVLRWCIPLFMLSLLVSNIFLFNQGVFYKATLTAQFALYLFALSGYVLKAGTVFFRLPYYFVSLNIALLFGFAKFILGKQSAAWERTQR